MNPKNVGEEDLSWKLKNVVVWLLREGADDNYLLVESRNGGLGHGYYPRGIVARFSHIL